MRIITEPFAVTKRHALAISRGTSAGGVNLLVRVTHAGIEGWGEMAPSDVTGDTAERAARDLSAAAESLHAFAPYEMQAIEERIDIKDGVPIGTAARAALDMALHDWLGKKTEMPLYRLFGLNTARIVPTSVTIGINPPEIVREIAPEILARTGARVLKVKLGSPDGIETDKAMFAAVQEAAASLPIIWRVDANGGWSVADSLTMMRWLAERGVELVEQPLPVGQEADLPALFANRPLPLLVDESVHTARDIPPLAHCVDGINLKLMKTGGLREALRVIHTARAHGLKTMIGCMGETSLAITAGAHLSPLLDYVDLDSHLNLRDDPFTGAQWQNGLVIPNELPGLGVEERTPVS